MLVISGEVAVEEEDVQRAVHWLHEAGLLSARAADRAPADNETIQTIARGMAASRAIEREACAAEVERELPEYSAKLEKQRIVQRIRARNKWTVPGSQGVTPTASEETQRCIVCNYVIECPKRHYAWHQVEAQKPRTPDATTSEHVARLLKVVEEGGYIVSSNQCEPIEIAFAKSEHRWWVDANGMGYVARPAGAEPPKPRTSEARSRCEHEWQHRCGKCGAPSEIDGCTETERSNALAALRKISSLTEHDSPIDQVAQETIAWLLMFEEQRTSEAMRVRSNGDVDGWRDCDDKPLPEDEQIDAAFPTRSGRHDLYQEAMRLVGAKYTKGGLVALVTWLLLKAEHRTNEAPPSNACRGCGKTLLVANQRMADGCPCNSARGINHGIVPTLVCTCDQCDPAQTGSTRWHLTEQRTNDAPSNKEPT